jgi:hypothetical protein
MTTITLKITRRPDCGYRLWSPELVSLILSGKDLSAILADAAGFIDYMLPFKEWTVVEPKDPNP